MDDERTIYGQGELLPGGGTQPLEAQFAELKNRIEEQDASWIHELPASGDDAAKSGKILVVASYNSAGHSSIDKISLIDGGDYGIKQLHLLVCLKKQKNKKTKNTVTTPPFSSAFLSPHLTMVLAF